MLNLFILPGLGQINYGHKKEGLKMAGNFILLLALCFCVAGISYCINIECINFVAALLVVLFSFLMVVIKWTSIYDIIKMDG